MRSGFFGIISDDGETYEPIKLEASLQVDGLRVRIEGRERGDLFSCRMWGSVLEILKIEAILTFQGTVRRIELEGGFYGIVSDDGTPFEPVNLDTSFQIDGMRVCVDARHLPDWVSAFMWGSIIEIIAIRPNDRRPYFPSNIR